MKEVIAENHAASLAEIPQPEELIIRIGQMIQELLEFSIGELEPHYTEINSSTVALIDIRDKIEFVDMNHDDSEI